jgi:multiple sugar transport system substrate-binding protein
MDISQRQLSRRAFLKLAGVAGIGASLSACNQILTPRQLSSNAPVQLVYQDWRTEWFPAMAQEMLARFNREHPNIQVFYVPDPENKVDQMNTDFAAGIAPDILSGCCDFFSDWANSGYLLDIRAYVESDLTQSEIEDWAPSQYRALFSRSGIQYALPMYHGALALYYNKDLFDKAGVDYPTERWTHDDYLQAMRQLTVRDGDQTIQWGSMFDVSWERIQIHVNAWGGHFVNQEDGFSCDMASPASLAAMEWLRARIWDDHVMATFLDVQNLSTSQAFIAQKVAMVEDGSWALKDILDKSNFRVGVAPIPAGPVRRATLASTDGYAIYANTRYPDEAWEFLKFLTSKDYGRAMARAHLLQPARASLVVEWIDMVRAEYPQKAAGMNLVAFADGQIKGYSVIAETFPIMTGVSKIATETWDQIYTLGNGPVSKMNEVCQQINAIQASAYRQSQDCGCSSHS